MVLWEIREEKASEILNRFDVVSLNPNGQRSLNCVYRYHKRVVIIAGKKNPFDTVQRAATDSHTLPNLKKWMSTPG